MTFYEFKVCIQNSISMKALCGKIIYIQIWDDIFLKFQFKEIQVIIYGHKFLIYFQNEFSFNRRNDVLPFVISSNRIFKLFKYPHFGTSKKSTQNFIFMNNL